MHNQAMSQKQALELAQDKGLDLVKIGCDKGIAVCRIVDKNKFLYEQKKKEKFVKNNNKGDLKEMQISPSIANHDLDIKVDKSRKILSKGYGLKISMKFRGRETEHVDDYLPKLDYMVKSLNDCSFIQKHLVKADKCVYIVLKAKV